MSPSVVHNPVTRSHTRILVPLILILLLGMASIGGLLVYFSQELDSAARQDLRERVALALRIEGELIADLATEYSYWDEGYEKLIRSPEPVFADDNIGSYMTDYLGVALSVAVDGRGRASFTFVDGSPGEIDLPGLMDAGLRQLRAQERLQDLPATGSHGAVRFEGRSFLFGLNTFTEEATEQTRDGSFLAIARELNPTYLEQLSYKFQIKGLRFADSDRPPTDLSLPLTDIPGEQIHLLTWLDPARSREIREGLAWVTASITLVMCLLALFVVRAELARHLDYSEALSRIAFRDSLTDIDNRRAFFEHGRSEIKRCERSGESLLLLVIDADDFKSVNDEFGHAAGDAVLVALARRVRAELRDYDILARIGGEEFAVIIPGTDLDEGMRTAERLRRAVASMHTSGGSVPRPVTVSIGLAQLMPGEDLEALLERADRALYQAKNAGRNRCIAG